MRARRWAAFALSLALAVGVSLGVGLWMRHRNGFESTRALNSGETLLQSGSEFTIEGFGQVDPPPAEDFELPEGAIVVRLDLRQDVLEVPAEPYDLSCEITLHTADATWRQDSDLPYLLEAETLCVPTAAGETRVISGLWTVPPQVLDADPWIEVRFHLTREGFSVHP